MRKKFVKAFIKNNFKFYLSLVVCSAICFSVFVTFYHVLYALSNGLNDYVENYEYADGLVFLNDNYTEEELKQFENIEGIKNYYKTHYNDFTIDESTTIRLNIVNFSTFPLYIVEAVEDEGIYLSVDFARANNIKAGDFINFKVDDEETPVRIKALVNSPFLLGITRNNLSQLETTSFGVAAIDSNSSSTLKEKLTNAAFVYYLEDGVDSNVIQEKIEDIFKEKINHIEIDEERYAIKSIENDLDALKPIVTFFPILMYLTGLVISMLFIKQFIDTKKRDIGILKSLGKDNIYIISVFMLYVTSIAIISSIIGLILSILQTRIYVNLYTNAVSLPIFSIKNNYFIIFMAFLVTFITNLIAVTVNIKNIVKIDVVNVINDINITKNHRSRFLRNKLITIKPFISTILNKPFRFIFSILNLILIVIIITTSVTVKRAKNDSINYTYNKQNNYKYIVHLKNVIENNYDNSFYESISVVKNGAENYYIDLTVLNNLDYLKLYDLNNNKLDLDDSGVIISEKQAKDLNVDVGDYININDKPIKISNISKQIYNFRVIMSYNLFNKTYGYNVANSIFLNQEVECLDNVSYISSNETMKKDLCSKMEYIDNYIIIIISIIIFVGVVVIFNVSVIYFREKEQLNKTLRTLGYSKTKIIFLSIVELIIQSIIALIIGIPIGFGFSEYVTREISTDYIIVYNNFSNIPIFEISIFIILTAILGRIIAAKDNIHN